jgi:hypothetical protein
MDESVYVTTGSVLVDEVTQMMDEDHVKVWTVVLARDDAVLIGYDGPDSNEVMVGYAGQSHPTRLYPRLPAGWSVIADMQGQLVRIVAYELPHGAAWWYPSEFNHNGSHPPG